MTAIEKIRALKQKQVWQLELILESIKLDPWLSQKAALMQCIQIEVEIEIQKREHERNG